MKGTFIVIDGLGGSGKTTQIEALKKRLSKAVFTKEPGGAPRAEKIREVLKSGDDEAGPLSDFFLFWAARAEHMTRLIQPTLLTGKTVVTDRFDSSTFAMQIRGDQEKKLEKLFWQCREATLGKLTPDIYIFLDVSPETAKKRRTTRVNRKGDEKYNDRFDEREEAYQKRVRAGYKEFAKKVKGHVINASQSFEDVHEAIWKIVSKRL